MLKKAVMLIGSLFVGIQVAPYGRNHANPPARQEPKWDRQETRQLAKRACFDCHSNETKWPWYAGIAPFSWLTQNHVAEGRRKLNLSEWDRPQKEAKDVVKTIQKGEMPLSSYLLAHPDARLQPAEKETLIAGLRATIKAQSAANPSERHEEEEEEEK
jgi:mono/diheme cytochrome c family protein